MSSYFFDYNLYKKRLNKKTGLFIPVCIFIIILLMVAICFIYPKSKTVNFYFVEVGNYMQYSQANSLAQEIQQKNAAGYVHFDGRYHVLTSYYLNLEDAENVVNNIKDEYPNANVFTLSIKQAKYANTNKENKTIKQTIESNEKLIKQLYTEIIRYDKNEISKDKFDLSLKRLSSDYSDIIDEFSSSFKTNSKMTNAKEKLTTIKNTIPSSADSFNLKYCLIKIVITHYSFLDFLS